MVATASAGQVALLCAVTDLESSVESVYLLCWHNGEAACGWLWVYPLRPLKE